MKSHAPAHTCKQIGHWSEERPQTAKQQSPSNLISGFFAQSPKLMSGFGQFLTIADDPMCGEYMERLWNAVCCTTTPGDVYRLQTSMPGMVLYEFAQDSFDYMIDSEFEKEITLTKANTLLAEQSIYWTFWSEEPDDHEIVAEIYSPPRLVGLKARDEVRDQLRQRRPRLLVVSPPCTKFSQLQNLRRHPERLPQDLMEATLPVDFSLTLLLDQLHRRDQCLFEHPDAATSWELKSARGCLARDEVLLVSANIWPKTKRGRPNHKEGLGSSWETS